ncbi:hypothetical protein F7725_027360 [Dissostichus mawsoni]|uniref:Uncharacterized protein n=1 Tax=Dissostichus mawsoni TaxID=36200 RepID=A0A7J5XCN5_DISMA|nr:hypothetical protein F7725_027360 [Dissostichus mawsoni]
MNRIILTAFSPDINTILEQITDEDFRRAEDFISLMRMLYTITLCVSSDKSSTCGQIIPILQKLKAHLTIKEEDFTLWPR